MTKVIVRIRVKMEPELEEEAGALTASQRRIMAQKLERWVHQLRVSAKILDRDALPRPGRSSLRSLPRRRLSLN